MDNFYEEMYEYLISEGIEDEEATEVVNYLFEDNIHEYGLITENRGRAFLNMLKAVGYMSGVLKPKAKQAVKQVVKKVEGTPLQGNFLPKLVKHKTLPKERCLSQELILSLLQVLLSHNQKYLLHNHQGS